MRKNQTSLTAAGIAIARAVESEKPIDERICNDPYARHLVPAWMECFPPAIRFVRLHTFGRGDDVCDFQYCHELRQS